jgi:hypothetical protein
MRFRAGNHSFSAAAKSFAAATLVAATLAQFFALSHEVTVRHFRCAEHGELTHVAVASVELTSSAPRLASALRTQDLETVDAHDHCTTAFTAKGWSSSPIVRDAVRSTPPPLIPTVPAPAPPRGRAFVLASAPKTSPPSVQSS